MTAVHKGDVVRLEFYDHTEGRTECLIEAFGRVRSVTRKTITIAGWQVVDRPEDFESETIYTILRSAITAVNVLDCA